MMEGGHKEVGVSVDSAEKYKTNPHYHELGTLESMQNIPIFIEDEARQMFEDRAKIEIDARGALEKELLIRHTPVIDLGACRVPSKSK